ncbi:hypothetical protein LIER_15179 [Lithospermum erythrorhizon]|uniref:Uncharacterized protein n=1 Tax=Lithospermum erythrorhizon TaxID=34254 RepID=A0AAV3Q4E3_LITER
MSEEEEQMLDENSSNEYAGPPIFYEEPAQAKISLNAITGPNTFSTFRLKGMINKQAIHILVDTGSTNTFLDESLAVQLNIPLVPAPPLMVNIADGNKLMSHLISSHFEWKIQGHKFSTSVRILPLGACQMVVGMQLTLLADTSKITLQAATSQADLQLISAKKLTKWMKHSNTPAISQLFSFQAADINSISAISDCHPNIIPLLQKFPDLFTNPIELPPSRNVNHTITLKPDAVARKFPPYRHSYSQKQEIEKIIAELLKSGFIQTSQSVFSSHVILVKKKDGTWKFCVDYQYLNELTVPQ